MMNDKAIDFMLDKGMSNETINRILKYDGYCKNEVDLLKRLENIYELLNFARLSNSNIEKVIYLNIGILDFSLSELCKLGVVLDTADINDKIMENISLVKGIVNYKRIFMRNLVAIQSGRDTLKNGLSFLTAADKYTYGQKYNLSYNIYSIFKINCASDEELEQFLDNKLKVNDKFYTVDDYIKIQSSIFYRKYLQYKNKKIMI